MGTIIILSYKAIMGAQNSHYRDFDFMSQYNQLQLDFIKQTPLFDVQSIAFPLSTKDMAIVDRNGRRVKIAGASWSGGHALRHCVSGLDRQPISKLCKDIRQNFGLNCVRITFSLQLFKKNKYVNQQFISENKYLLGKTAQQIFEHIVTTLTQQGLMVILNNHTSKSQWCCSDKDGDGLWFNKQYPKNQYFSCLNKLATLFKDNKRVIGIDLRNQVRPSDIGKPTWGDTTDFDWKKAAEEIGNSILKNAPHMLIIVGGLNYQLDLTGVLKYPVQLEQPNKLVYSGHFYSFSWGPQIIWKSMSEQQFRQKLFNQQLYVRGINGKGVPFILGQFGGNTRSQPWIYLIKYLKELDVDWIYWCLDGYKCDKQQDETYGIWNYQFTNVRHPQMLGDLKKIANSSRGTYN